VLLSPFFLSRRVFTRRLTPSLRTLLAVAPIFLCKRLPTLAVTATTTLPEIRAARPMGG